MSETKNEVKEDTEEIRIAKHIGEQISGKFYCPECSIPPDRLQKIYVFGDSENELYCPHCDLTVELVVKLA